VAVDRRGFLVRSGLALAAGGATWRLAENWAAEAQPFARRGWDSIRDEFNLDPSWVHFGLLYLTSHPRSVRMAIQAHRGGLDKNPVRYIQLNNSQAEARVLAAAASYLGTNAGDIALTDSTTMGLGLLYNGIDLRAGQEALTTRHDFFATHEALQLKAQRSGATVRQISLYAEPEHASEDAIVSALLGAVASNTRVVAITWVHSSSGVKLPVRRIADGLREINATRGEGNEVLLCVDGVHGIGVENVSMPDLGCDFFIAGCHKWLFGPRGTGFVWGAPSAWPYAGPTIPSFGGGSHGANNTPGGFHSFEHRWSLGEAFRFHLSIGKSKIEARIHSLARQLKKGLATMDHVTLKTPLADSISAGIVCFMVDGMSPTAVVTALRNRGIIATTTPYSPSYARLAPGIVNTPDEVEVVLDAIRALGKR
jgi:selenocysteine lyase/cysteine desulfurase